MPFQTSDIIAALALAVAAASFALSYLQWFGASPRFFITLMPDAVLMPDPHPGPKLALYVTNRGGTPTTITHCVIFLYRGWLHRWVLRKPYMTAIVPNPSANPMAPGIPARIGVNESWSGLIYYRDEIPDARQRGHLYVGVIASHSQRTFLKKVPKKKADIPKREVSAAAEAM